MAEGIVRPPVSRKIEDAVEELQKKWPEIQKRFTALTGDELILTCTHRTVDEQQRLYAQGRSTKGQIVTWVDGRTKMSNHNYYPSRAIDVAVLSGGKVNWSPDAFDALAIVCKDLGLTWGGTWHFKDLPHIEVTWKTNA